MSGSWRIGRVAGVDVYAHFTLALLLGWVALLHDLARDGPASTAGDVLTILVLFGSLVLHEAGHALAAWRLGIRTRDIVLLPVGGVARLERLPEDPGQEVLVALAGPAVNVLLAAGTYLALTLVRRVSPSPEAMRMAEGFLGRSLRINAALALFNLLPASPMDGGRVLRALLVMRLDRARATRVAALVGQAVAIVFGLLGVVLHPLLILIALFVSLAAADEAGRLQARPAPAGSPLMPVMLADYGTLRPSDSLARAAVQARTSPPQDFPVVEDGRLVGLLTRHDLGAALARDGPDASVGDVMRRGFVAAAPGETLQAALSRLRESGDQTLLVAQDGRLLGMVTARDLADVLMILEAAQCPGPGPGEGGSRIRAGFPARHAEAHPSNGVPRRG